MNVFRVALPGYDALTDTNPDHFALYTDTGGDFVLIKEFQRGSVTLGAGGSQNITHNLGYVPFFLVFVNDTTVSSTTWKLVGIPTISGQFLAGADSSILNIFNNNASTFTYKYFIFYDNQVGSSGITLSESANVIKIARNGYNVEAEKDPNHLIFHSDLNTFKIVHQQRLDLPIVMGTSNYQFAHNSPLSNTSCLQVFAKWPDGKVNTVTPFGGGIRSFDESRSLNDIYFDNTNIYINYGFVSSNFTLHLAWLIYEAALS